MNYQINLEDFKFSMPIAMRWNDMDALGHVNNIYYFEYFQIARSQYMITASPTWDWTKNMFVIGHIECDYYKELSLKHQNPIIRTRTTSLSTKSFELEYIISSTDDQGNEIIHAKGKSINVMIDMAARKSTTLPTWLKEELMAYEPALKTI